MNEVLPTNTNDPLFGITLSILAYGAGVWLNRKIRTPLVNPILVAAFLVVTFLLFWRIPYEDYQAGGDVITLFLTPATALLAVKVYEEIRLLKKNWLPVLVGSAAGAATSLLVVWLLATWLGLDETLMVSLLPKGVTTTIAVPLSEEQGGIVPVTMFALIVSGMIGAATFPSLLKWLHIKDPVEAGIAIGTASHALGTARAIELDDTIGAMSGCAIGIAGLWTVLFLAFAG